MASAYVGTCLMPYLFGMIVKYISASWFTGYMFVMLVIMVVAHEVLLKRTKK